MKEKFTTWYYKEEQKQINPENGDANAVMVRPTLIWDLQPWNNSTLHGWWTCPAISAVEKKNAGIDQLLNKSLSLPLEGPIEETEGFMEISKSVHVTKLSILNNDWEEQKDFFITVRLTFRGIQLPS